MSKLMEDFGGSQLRLSEPIANILLVDDNRANLVVLRSILEDLGQNLVEVSSGEDALQCVHANEFAVCLLDVVMPGISGFETAKRIRALKRSRHLPIIFLTATEIDGAQLAEGYRLGAVDFLTKPLTPVVLQAKVRGFVELFQEKQLAIREAEQLRLLVQGTTEYAIFMLDNQGYVLTWNSGAKRLKGYEADEIIGRHFSAFYPQDAIDRDWPTHELNVARTEGRFEDEGWRIRKDGSQFWANVVITALYDPEGNLRGFSKVTRDMSERKKAEENACRLVEETTARRVAEENARLIQEQRERLHVTLASIGDAVISADADGRVEFLNSVAEQLVGWTTADAAGRNLSEVFRIVNEKTHEPVENPALRAMREGRIVGLANHTILIAKDGRECPIDDSAAPIRDVAGTIVGGVLVFRDVSEIKKSQAALLESEGRLRLALEAGQMGVWDWNLRTKEANWSESFEPLHGLAPGAFDGTLEGFQKLIHPADRASVTQAIQQAVEQGSGYDLEFRNIWPDGSVHWIAGKGLVFPGSDGAPERMIGIGMDVTHRKRSEQTARFLADASATLAVLVDFNSTLQRVVSLAVPYFADWATVDLVDPDGSLRRVAVAHVDPSKVALAHELQERFRPESKSPQGVWNVLRSGKSEMVSEISDELLARTVQDQEILQIVRKLGLKSYIGVPLKVRGKILGVITFISAESGHRYDAADLSVAQDVADRGAIAIENSLLYRELKDTDRRKDEFLATLAHELRNPLAPIRNSLQILKMPKIDTATAEQTRDIMERQVHHLVRLVDDLLDVSRVMRGKIELRKEPVELSTIVARAVETAKPLIETQHHHLHLSVSPESLCLDADPVRLAQVVGNLLMNSAKYTEPHGSIWLSAQREGDALVLRVRDTGIGISPDMLPHIFELFVQADHAFTKAQGGLGIGLTLVKNLVEMHGGTVDATSGGLGKGSEFAVRLPLALPESQRPVERGFEQTSTSPPSGNRLLVVDDNRDAANSLAMLLQLQGYQVRVVHDGPGALEAARDFCPEIIFLDIGMPGMDGYEVARRIRKMPGLENTVLAALTGWGQQEDRRRTTDAGFNHHLVKPPEPTAVEGVLAELKSRETLKV